MFLFQLDLIAFRRSAKEFLRKLNGFPHFQLNLLLLRCWDIIYVGNCKHRGILQIFFILLLELFSCFILLLEYMTSGRAKTSELSFILFNPFSLNINAVLYLKGTNVKLFMYM